MRDSGDAAERRMIQNGGGFPTLHTQTGEGTPVSERCSVSAAQAECVCCCCDVAVGRRDSCHHLNVQRGLSSRLLGVVLANDLIVRHGVEGHGHVAGVVGDVQLIEALSLPLDHTLTDVVAPHNLVSRHLHAPHSHSSTFERQTRAAARVVCWLSVCCLTP
jgi:hypothetical protein